MTKLRRAFYRRPAIEVAPGLIGKILVRRFPDGAETRRARIVETEAYVGAHDLACHASKGRTNRTEVMFGPPGHAYVYLIYGMYRMLNVVTSDVGDAQAVLVRAAEPLDDWDANLSGPGRLARALHLTAGDNGLDLTGGDLFLVEDCRLARPRVGRDVRVGIDYARHWKDALLRFYDAESAAVSRPRPKSGADDERVGARRR
jgi:DNA-3-methyladenine glycosylase